MTTQTLPNGSAASDSQVISKSQVWTGRAISGLVVLFLLVDGGMKLFKPAVVVKTTRELGYAESDIIGIGVLLLVCTLLYIIPRTSIVGALLLTGYFGGAIASQVRAEQSWFNVSFAFVFGGLIWAGLWLRNVRLRTLLP